MIRCRPLFAVLMLLVSGAAAAHSPASSHLTLEQNDDEIRLTADLAILDLAALLPIDSDADSRITWGELLDAQAAIDRQFRATTQLTAGESECALILAPGATALTSYGETTHLSLRYRARCDTGADLALAASLFFELDPAHRVFVRKRGSDALQVLTAARPGASLSGNERQAIGLLREGFAHILEGYDHLLFLMLLVLPAFTASGFKVRVLHLAGIITTFTLAHSITLGLAALGFVALPGKPVEIAIALSIVAAGILNIWKPRHRIGWKLAAGFGLLHGFGFAGALAEIGFEGSSLVLNLLAFNLGVELGQLFIVALALPLLIVIAQWSKYGGVVVRTASAAGVALGLAWTLSRL